MLELLNDKRTPTCPYCGMAKLEIEDIIHSWDETTDTGRDITVEQHIGFCPNCNHRFFYEYDAPIAGTGHFIHTYQENLDPLPSFEGEPRKIVMGDVTAKSFADEIWANLNPDNKVSLFVQTIDLASGERDTVIINKHN